MKFNFIVIFSSICTWVVLFYVELQKFFMHWVEFIHVPQSVKIKVIHLFSKLEIKITSFHSVTDKFFVRYVDKKWKNSKFVSIFELTNWGSDNLDFRIFFPSWFFLVSTSCPIMSHVFSCSISLVIVKNKRGFSIFKIFIQKNNIDKNIRTRYTREITND